MNDELRKLLNRVSAYRYSYKVLADKMEDIIKEVRQLEIEIDNCEEEINDGIVKNHNGDEN